MGQKYASREQGWKGKMIDLKILIERFSYDPDTGVVSHRSGGGRAGTVNKKGYRYLSLTIGGRQYRPLAHRVAWLLTTGEWPREEIDHRNGDKDDNRLANLREATHGQNQHNRTIDKSNTSGFFGVSWHASKNKWRAAIKIEDRHIHVGYFSTPEKAYAAYLAAKSVYHPFQPALRSPWPQMMMSPIWI